MSASHSPDGCVCARIGEIEAGTADARIQAQTRGSCRLLSAKRFSWLMELKMILSAGDHLGDF
jgi:hypothetical protein